MYEIKSGDARSITLRQIWVDYRTYRGLKDNTIKCYEVHLRNYLNDWQDLPLSELSKSAVLMKYKDLTDRFSASTANGALRIARSLITFGCSLYEIQYENPVLVLTHLRAWRKENQRRGQIPFHKFPDWIQAVDKDPNPTARDYLKFLAHTGLRREEAAELRWSNVDLQDASFIAYDTKNGEDLRLPLARFSLDLLKRRHAERISGYVFSGEDVNKPFNLSTFAVKKICWEADLLFTPHDLRRTFLTIGDSLDIELHVLKRLANHTQMSHDMTLRYIQSSVHRLREPAEQISQKIVELCSGNTSTEIDQSVVKPGFRRH